MRPDGQKPGLPATAPVTAQALAQAGRFGLVVVLGLGIDLSVTLGLVRLAGLALPVAAACGFGAGAVVNYLMHEAWTFRHPGAALRLSARRGGLYLLVLGMVFAVRVGSVALLERLLPAPGLAPLVLTLAIGLSFCAHFILSRSLAFRRPPEPRGSTDAR